MVKKRKGEPHSEYLRRLLEENLARADALSQGRTKLAHDFGVTFSCIYADMIDRLHEEAEVSEYFQKPDFNMKYQNPRLQYLTSDENYAVVTEKGSDKFVLVKVISISHHAGTIETIHVDGCIEGRYCFEVLLKYMIQKEQEKERKAQPKLLSIADAVPCKLCGATPAYLCSIDTYTGAIGCVNPSCTFGLFGRGLFAVLPFTAEGGRQALEEEDRLVRNWNSMQGDGTDSVTIQKHEDAVEGPGSTSLQMSMRRSLDYEYGQK